MSAKTCQNMPKHAKTIQRMYEDASLASCLVPFHPQQTVGKEQKIRKKSQRANENNRIDRMGKMAHEANNASSRWNICNME